MGPAPFSRAVKRGDIPTVKKMVSKRIVDVNTSLDATGATALMYASRAGHLEMVQCLVEAGAALEVMDASKNAVVIRAIDQAAEVGSASVVKFLLEVGADIESKYTKHHSALIVAIKSGHLDVTKCLIKAGAKVNLRRGEKHTPLTRACTDGKYIEIVEYLLEAGAEPNLPGKYGMPPLHHAAESGNKAIVEVLLAANVDVNERCHEKTALHRAASTGNLQVVQCLIQAGADILTVEEGVKMALKLAIENDHTDIAKLLIAAGTPFQHHSNYGGNKNVLGHAMEAPNLAIVKALVEAGANVDEVSSHTSVKSLHVAAELGHEDMMRFFVSKGACVEAKDRLGSTPLLYAISRSTENKEANIVRILVQEAGANVNATNDAGVTPLIRAVRHENVAIAQCLLAAGANPNVADKNGETPLHLAAYHWLPEMVRCLLASGADIYARAKDDKLPIDRAEQRWNEIEQPGSRVWYPPAAHPHAAFLATCIAITPGSLRCFGCLPRSYAGLGHVALVDLWRHRREELHKLIGLMPDEEKAIVRTLLLCFNRRFSSMDPEICMQLIQEALPVGGRPKAEFVSIWQSKHVVYTETEDITEDEDDSLSDSSTDDDDEEEPEVVNDDNEEPEVVDGLVVTNYKVECW